MSAADRIPTLLLWLPCALFVLHDLEEALFLKPWLDRNREWLTQRFPQLSRRLLPHMDRISARSFAAMAAEEFALLALATGYAQASGNYYPWLAFFLAFALHLLIHLAQGLAVRRCVPVLATSVMCLPVCVWLLAEIENPRLFTLRELVVCGVCGTLAAAVNLWLMHRLTARVARR